MEDVDDESSGIVWENFEDEAFPEPFFFEVVDAGPGKRLQGAEEANFRFGRNPSVGISTIGRLVESYQEENPSVRIVNLFDIPHEVESIYDHRVRNGVGELRVRWKGWSEKWDTWEREEILRRDASSLLSLHIATFFYEGRTSKTWKVLEYLNDHLEKALLKGNPPDYLLLSRLASHRFEVSNGCVLPPKPEEVQDMMDRVEALLKPGSNHRWLQIFKGSIWTALRSLRRRLRVLDNNEIWRLRLQMVHPKLRVHVENLVDDASPAKDLTFIEEYDLSPSIPVVPPWGGCRCRDKSCFETGCCGLIVDDATAACYRNYDSAQVLTQIKNRRPLFECNYKCDCDLRCENRVTQRGPQLSLTLFRRLDGNWSVRTRAPLDRGTFVGEYFGEVITLSEAESRDSAHIMVLHPSDGGEASCAIDAGRKCNITRFFNQSSEPNLMIRYVFIDNQHMFAPRVALFTNRDILENEELTLEHCKRS